MRRREEGKERTPLERMSKTEARSGELEGRKDAMIYMSEF
jgi:hypothetical protein